MHFYKLFYFCVFYLFHITKKASYQHNILYIVFFFGFIFEVFVVFRLKERVIGCFQIKKLYLLSCAGRKYFCWIIIT